MIWILLYCLYNRVGYILKRSQVIKIGLDRLIYRLRDVVNRQIDIYLYIDRQVDRQVIYSLGKVILEEIEEKVNKDSQNIFYNFLINKNDILRK